MTDIYGLLDEEGLLRYVGKTRKALSERLSSHWHDAQCGRGRSSRIDWLRSLTRRPTMRFMDVVLGSENPNTRERYWIELAQDYGCVLVNERNGGKIKREEASEDLITLTTLGSTTERAAAECRLAKQHCRERKAASREQDRAEEHEREQAYLYVRQIKSRRRNLIKISRPEFEAAFKRGLEGYFAARPSIEECWLLTDQCLWLADLPDVPIQDQLEYFRLLTIDKFMGCAMFAFDYWHFSRPTIQKPTTTAGPSIFDK